MKYWDRIEALGSLSELDIYVCNPDDIQITLEREKTKENICISYLQLKEILHVVEREFPTKFESDSRTKK